MQLASCYFPFPCVSNEPTPWHLSLPFPNSNDNFYLYRLITVLTQFHTMDNLVAIQELKVCQSLPSQPFSSQTMCFSKSGLIQQIPIQISTAKLASCEVAGIAHKTTLIPDTTCNFGEPQISILHQKNSKGSLESVILTVYYRKGTQIKINQGERHIGQSPGKVPRVVPMEGEETSLAQMDDSTCRVLLTREPQISLGMESLHWDPICRHG